MTAKPKFEFDQLYELKQRIDRLRTVHASSLGFFRDKVSGSFKHTQDRPDDEKISMSSTATCIGSLVEAGIWKKKDNGLKDRAWWVGKEFDYYSKLLSEDWISAGLDKENAFTVAFVIEACCYLRTVAESPEAKKMDDAELRKKFAYGVKKLKEALGDGAVCVAEYPPSAFLTQLAARALSRAKELDASTQEKITSWAALEIRSQLALIAADSRVADSLQLAFALVLWATYLPPARQTPTDQELVRLGLQVFFSQQQKNGGWPQSRPLFHYPKAGSAYCYDYELLAQLLLADGLHETLFRYIPNFASAVEALEDGLFQLDRDAVGWASNQTSKYPGPESWATASVYLFLFALDRFLAEAIRRAAASEVEANYLGVVAPKTDPKDFATDFLDCPLTAKEGETEKLKSTIFDVLVGPLARNVGVVKRGLKLPEGVPVSAILFGPPGTSKTEIAEQIATFVGWPLVTVDPSYFVKSGLDQIQAQANRIFRMLAAAEQLVVLFDEFDEMVRNRADARELLSRFLTTAMLPKLAKINKERRILFLVATNYIDTFDTAISRPGRFDLVLQMMPPLAEAKLEFDKWKEALAGVVTDEPARGDLAKLTYLETKNLVVRLQKAKEADRPAVFRKAVRECTLNRPNERYALPNDASTQSPASGEEALPLPAIQAEDEFVEPENSWRRTQQREVRFVR